MLDRVMSWVIPVISVLTTYLLGRVQATHSGKVTAYKEAYESFYLPFISMLYETQIWELNFSGLSIPARQKLFRLVADNIRYMDRDALEWMDVLYAHHSIVLLDEVIGQDSYIITPERLNEVFGNLTIKVLDRATWLAEKLHQPRLGEHARALYLETPGVPGM